MIRFGKLLRVYCDTNVWSRPFDNQSHPRIRKEAEAFAALLTAAQERRCLIVTSALLEAELAQMPDVTKYQEVRTSIASLGPALPLTSEVAALAKQLLTTTPLKPADAFHVAFAAQGRADRFLTCDDRLLAAKAVIERTLTQTGAGLTVWNPVDFIHRELK